MDITKLKVNHLPKKVKFFECENWNFYINEDWVITFTTLREIDHEKISELHANISSIESELEHVDDIFTRDDLLSQLSRLNSKLQFEMRDEYEQPYQVKVTEKQLPLWIDFAKSAKKDSVWSVAYATGCVLDFGTSTDIVYNTQSFPREWLCFKKAA